MTSNETAFGAGVSEAPAPDEGQTPAEGQTPETAPAPDAGAASPGTSTENPRAWAEGIDPAQLSGEHFSGVETIEDLVARTNVLAARAQDAGVKVPGEGASEEEIAAYHKAIGVPESADGYEIPAPSPESGLDVDEGVQKWAGETFRELGLSKEQGQKLGAKWNEYMEARVSEAMEQQRQQGEKTTQALKQDFGEEYTARMRNMHVAMKDVLGEDSFEAFSQLMSDPVYGNNEQLLRALFKFSDFHAKAVGEDGLKGIGGGHPQGESTSEIEQRIQDLTGAKDSPYWNNEHPDHAAKVREVRDLYAKLAERKAK